MKLWKLYTPEEEKQLADELIDRYWNRGWSQKQIIKHYQLSYETFNEFRDKYGLRKSPSEYNKKSIDRRFTKSELDILAENIRHDFCDNLMLMPDLLRKYDITMTDYYNIRDRYHFSETKEQHWERTKKANLRIHGVEHMSHIKDHSKKSYETFHKNYGVGSDGRVEVNLRFYEMIRNPNLSFEQFCKVRDTMLSGEGLEELLLSVPKRYRSYLYLSKIWDTSYDVIQRSVERNNLT